MGPLTGFAMNPARDFGPKFFAYLAGWGELALTGGREVPYFIVPMVAPVLGALAGAWLYKKQLAAIYLVIAAANNYLKGNTMTDKNTSLH